MAIKNNHKKGKKIVKLSCALHKLLIGIYTYYKSLRACLVNCNGNDIEISRGVHHTAQTAKTAPKPLAKWHNHTAPQVIVHRTTPHRIV